MIYAVNVHTFLVISKYHMYVFLSLYNIVVLYDSRKNKQEIGFGIVLKRFKGGCGLKSK